MWDVGSERPVGAEVAVRVATSPAGSVNTPLGVAARASAGVTAQTAAASMPATAETAVRCR
jgi:hypothetical protein